MRCLSLVPLLLGTFASAGELSIGGGNYVRVENGKIVEHNFADSLHIPSMRNAAGDGSTTDDNVFNGQISISDALDPDSPFSQWVDDLLNPESDPYKQAVINALKILLAILLAALAPLGIDNFTVLILGFAPGSVQVEYEMSIPTDQYTAAGSPSASALGDAVYNAIDDSNDGADLVDSNGDSLGITLDNTATTVTGDDGLVIPSTCPPCWRVVEGDCVPDPAYMTLTCGNGQMSLSVQHCVMGNTDLESLRLDGTTCDFSSGHIVEDGANYVATVALDSCATSMVFNSNNVTFANALTGTYQDDGGIINTQDQYRVEFECAYDTEVDGISDSTEVTASVLTGPSIGQGEFSFDLKFFTDDSFSSEDTSGAPVRVGTQLNFGVEFSNPIAGVEFTVTDCSVYSDSDYTADSTLEYGIFTNKCPNTRVAFTSYVGTDAELVQFSYTVFEFKTSASNTLHLSCHIVVCDSADATSTCKAPANCSRRRKRSLEEGTTYYRVSHDFIAA